MKKYRLFAKIEYIILGKGGERRMKKTAKSSLFAMFMFIILLSLTGCGGDKLVGKMDKDGIKSSIEITFKDNKADKMKLTVEADSNDEAKDAVKSFKKMYEKADVKQSGKKVIITMDTVEFINTIGEASTKINNEDLTKEKMTEILKKAGYEIK